MSAAPALAIQEDVARAFSMKERRVFTREDGSVYAIVGSNPDLGVVSDVWFGTYDGAVEFRAVLEHVRDLFHAGGYRYWLADLRFMASGFAESEDWLVYELMPAVYFSGLKREAVVLPPDEIDSEGEDAYKTASSALRDLADGRVRGFSDIQLAKRWLLDGALPGS